MYEYTNFKELSHRPNLTDKIDWAQWVTSATANPEYDLWMT